MLSKETAEPGPAPCSKAHSWVASSILRKLLTQAFSCDWPRALTRLGIAMAASMPIRLTTIIISSNVNPRVRFAEVFISCLVICNRTLPSPTTTGREHAGCHLQKGEKSEPKAKAAEMEELRRYGSDFPANKPRLVSSFSLNYPSFGLHFEAGKGLGRKEGDRDAQGESGLEGVLKLGNKGGGI